MFKKLTIGAVALVLPLGALAAPESYTVDPTHTFPHFEVGHFGVSNWRGRFEKTTGKFTIDRAAKAGSVDITVQTASLSSGDHDKGARPRSLDDHLRTPDFFNVAEFPTMTYKSTSVKFAGDNPGSIEGNLTLLGVTKPIVVKATFLGEGKDPWGGYRAGFEGTTSISRKEFFPAGMDVGPQSDAVELYITFEGVKAK